MQHFLVTIIRNIAGFMCGAFLCIPAIPGALAHDVFLSEQIPNGQSRQLLPVFGGRADPVPVGAALNLRVQDQDTCSAEITVTNTNGELTISPGLVQTGVAVDFGIVAAQPGEFTIQVGWVGADYGGAGPCQEYHLPGDDIVINVIDPAGESTANLEASADAGDPVNTANGEHHVKEKPDLYVGGPLPLFFSRYFASYLRRNFIVGDLGDNWRHNFEWRIYWVGNLIRLVDDRGRYATYTSDGMGAWTQQDNLDLPYQLRQDNQEINVFDPRSGLLYNFNPMGQLARIEDGKGNILTLSYYEDFYYPEARKLKEVSNNQADSRKLTFYYATIGNLTKLTGVLEVIGGISNRSVSFGYDANGDNLLQYQSPRYRVTNYDYVTPPVGADRGMMRFKQLPKGNYHYLQDYIGLESQTDSGKVGTQTDGNGNVTTFTYDSPTQTTIIDPALDSTVHFYNADGELVSYQSKDGLNVGISNDSAGRRDSITDRLGDTVSYDYHAGSGKISAIHHADGSTTSYSYSTRTDSNGFDHFDLSGIAWPDGTNETFVHDAYGNVISHTDPAGYERTYTYNEFGQVLTHTNAAGGTTSYSYDSYGDLETVTDAAGNTTTHTYDEIRNPLMTTFADGSTRNLGYDYHRNLVVATDERGYTTYLDYDNNDNLLAVYDPEGGGTVFAYDNMDRPIGVTDARYNQATYSYDALGRVQSTTDQSGQVSTFNYDERGHLTSILDPGGNVWAWQYDPEGGVSAQVDPLGNIVNIGSNTTGNATSTTDALGNPLSVQRDVMERITALTDRAGGTSTFTYDARGNLTSTTLPGGEVGASYGYDALGNVVQVTDPNGSNWQSNFDNLSRLLSTTDPIGNTTTYQYDNRHRPALINFPGGHSLQTTYDAVGNVQALNFSDGTSLGFTADSLNRIVSADGLALAYNPNGSIVGSNGINMVYTPNDRVETIAFTVEKEITYTYNSRNLVSEITDYLGGVTTFTYDAAGRVISMGRPNGITTSYGYDANNRVVNISESGISSIVLNRDANGLIVTAVRDLPEATSAPGSVKNFTYDAASQVSSYSYDALGRVVGNDRHTYTWDLAGRLTQLDDGVEPVIYTYDALGNRTSRTVGGTTTNYVVNYGLGLPSASIERQGLTDVRYYVHSPGGELLYSILASDDSRRYYHYDELGNTQFLTDDGGSVTASYTYDAYGELLSDSGPPDQPFTWQGQHGVMREPGDVYYMRARYYDSASGRFLSRDPIKSMRPRNINPYQYALNNPMHFVDPTGREITSEDVLDVVEIGLISVASTGVFALTMVAMPVSVAACEIVGFEVAVAASATTACATQTGGIAAFYNAWGYRAQLRAEGSRQRWEMKWRARQRRNEESWRLAELRQQRDREWASVCDAEFVATPDFDAVSGRQEQEAADYRRWVPGASYDASRGKPYDIGYARGDDAVEIFSDTPFNSALDDKYDTRDRWEREFDEKQDKRMQELFEQFRRKSSKREAQVEKAPARAGSILNDVRRQNRKDIPIC